MRMREGTRDARSMQRAHLMPACGKRDLPGLVDHCVHNQLIDVAGALFGHRRGVLLQERWRTAA